MGNPAAVRVGPGLLYVAPVGETAPTNGTADPEQGNWVPIGYTEEGHTMTSETNWEDIEVAEELRPINTLPTNSTETISFSMAEYTVRNLSIAFNGGTIGSPTGGTVKFEPAELGEEQFLAILWQDGAVGSVTEALLCKKCRQVGSVESARQKAPNKTLIPVEFRLLVPDDDSAVWERYAPATLDYTDPH